MSEKLAESSDKIKCVVRILNLAVAGTMVGFGIAGIIFIFIGSVFSGKFFLAFSPIFMILFGFMVLGAECNFKLIVKHFGFLQSLIGRGIFNIYLASTVFFYFSCGSNQEVIGWVLGIIMFVMGIFYFILHCCGGSAYKPEQPTKEQMM